MEQTKEYWEKVLAERAEILRKISLEEKMTRRKNEDGTYPYLESNKKISDYLAGKNPPETPSRVIQNDKTKN